MKSKGFLLGVLGWLLLWAGSVDARPVAELPRGVDTLDLTPYLAWYQDADADATPAAMFARAADGGFAPMPAGGPTFGFQDGAWWFHARLLNHDPDEPRWLLVQQYALSDYLDVYLRYPDGRVVHQAAGDMRPFAARAVRYRHPNFRVSLPAGQPVELLVRVQSESSMQVPLGLYTPSAFAELARDAQFGMGLYYGILIALLVYNLVLWLVLRDHGYFWYLFHVAGFGLVLFCLNGLAYEYLWPRSPQLQDWSVPVSICIALMAMLQFTRHFMELKRRMPVGNRIALGLIAFFAAWGVASLFLPYGDSVPVAAAAVFPGIGFIVGVSIEMVRRGYRPARLFLVAWALFLLGIGAFSAIAFGLLEKTFYTEYGLQFGSAIEMLLLSVALGHRYAALRNENERIVRSANEELERNVSVRTEELSRALEQLGDANSRLREYSRRDPLTGVYNRRHFRDAFEQQLRDPRHRLEPLALLIADLDNFKQVNDGHGHLVGDACLRAAARLFDEELSARGGLVARFGGEEFVALLPGMDADAALQAAEAVRLRIQCPGADDDGPPLPLTISIGVHVVAPGERPTPEDVIRAADEALYRAKHAGRDRVALADATLAVGA
ncbi:MAG TPA: diguanylate cyclase, partial [Xanthomonadaceae bacterium]|nr:diguanylate cyclase [Xanthomonadaceae bacterium]